LNFIEDVKNNISNFLIGNNMLALKGICNHATQINYNPAIILTNSLDGEAKDVAKYFVYLAFILTNYSYYENNKLLFEEIFIENFKTKNEHEKFENFLSTSLNELSASDKKLLSSNKFCILTGGETTVKLTGSTKESIGGRNQEMVLSFKIEFINLIKRLETSTNGKFLFASLGSDGIDGPTDAAGAFITSTDIIDENNEFDFMNKCLREHDSYRYFDKSNGLIKVGHTGTNVSDIQMLLIDNSE
jgi:glycerate-2-kinase